MNPEIHFSEISTYLKCRKLHEFSYIQRIEPRFNNSVISFGTFGHKALEVLIRTNGNEQQAQREIAVLCSELQSKVLQPEQKHQLEQLAADAFKVGVRAFKWLNGRLVTVTEPEPLIEKHLRYTREGIDFIGTPDWIAQDTEDTGIWVIDHKYRKNFREPWSEELNLQMIFYQGLAKYSIGLETVGTKQFQIRNFAPKTPSLTQKGKVSKKDIMTTWEIYEDFVEQQGEEPLLYLEMKPKLDKHIWHDLDSTRVYRSASEVDKTWEEVIIPTALDIVHRKQKPHRCYDYFTCRNCGMKDYCVTEAKGADTNWLLQTSYKSKDEVESVFEVEFASEDTGADQDQQTY